MVQQRSVTPKDAGRATVISRFEQRLDELVGETVRQIFAGIPAYADVPQLVENVRQHVEAHYRTLVRHLAADTPLTREDLLFLRRFTAQRVGRIPVTDYMRAWLIGQDIIWAALLEEGRDEATREVVLGLVSRLLSFINLSATYAAELYIELESFAAADSERVRRDLLEDLLASRPIPLGPAQEAARQAGLAPDTPCLVVVAVPRVAPSDENVLHSAAATLARACECQLMPLTVRRRDEIVIVMSAGENDVGRLTAGLTDAHRRLARQDVRLAVGVSTVHAGLVGVGTAHREARGAADCVGPEGGVLALPALRPFDYLLSFRDSTAERLIPPEIQTFVESDLENGGVLTTTLLAYVDCSLSPKALSERLHVHTNTAHYRLNRIAELTGRDLRNLADVLDLVVAIRLADPLGDRPPATWG